MFRKRLPWLLSLLAILFLAWSSPVAAQSARSLLKKGNKLFAAGDYKAAFEAFQAGNKKRPSPAFLRSMAFCKMKLYDHRAARDLLSSYLEKYRRARDRAKLKTTLTNLEEVVATRVKISSTPAGAAIYIDAEAGGKVGETPKEVTIEPGTHTLILRKAGFAVTTKTFTIKARQSLTLNVAMEVPLKVTSTPPGAEVYVDKVEGKALGKTPLTDGTIAPGKRTVFVKAKGYQTFKRELDVKGPVTLDAKLAMGLRIESEPAGAVVSIDGTKIEGVTPIDAALAPGTHKIVITLDGFKVYEKTVSLSPGVDASFKATLRGGLLKMRSGPSGALVKVGGLTLGKTPLTKAVPLGTKTVVLEHPSKRRWSKRLAFDDTTMLDAQVEMGSPSWPFWLMAGTAAAAGIAGGALGIVALGSENDYTDWSGQAHKDGKDSSTDWCIAGEGAKYEFDDLQKCPYGKQDAATGLLITAGVVAAASVLYYLIWMRPSEKIKRQARVVARTKALSPTPEAKQPL